MRTRDNETECPRFSGSVPPSLTQPLIGNFKILRQLADLWLRASAASLALRDLSGLASVRVRRNLSDYKRQVLRLAVECQEKTFIPRQNGFRGLSS
jgi:hypothetical protein